MKTIEIDFDVHRLIELERRGFEEPENAALRRLLKLPEAVETMQEMALADTTKANQKNLGNGAAWSWKGVALPHATELRMEYRGQMVRGRVEHGKWVVEGNSYTSPSDAAGSSVKTKSGERPSLNGWLYWEVKRPGDSTWRKLKGLK